MLSRRAMMNDEIVSAEGKNLLLQKCKGSYLHGMKVYGRTTQETTTGAQLLDFSSAVDIENTVSGVKATINGDGSYTLTGTALDAVGNLWLMGGYYSEEQNPDVLFTLSAGTYTVTGINLFKYRSPIGGGTLGTKSTFTLTEDTVITGVRNQGLVVGQTYNETVYPMLNDGSELLTWEPYTGGVPSPNPDYPQELVSVGIKGSIEVSITDGADNAQSLSMLTPNGLPGIPVSSGGNYTDKNGQQWIADYRDWKRGVDVRMVATETPKTTFIVRETTDVSGRYIFTGAFKNIYKNGSNSALITHGFYSNYGALKNKWAISGTSFYYYPEGKTTVEELEEKIIALINSDNPLTFVGQLATPIETPIPADELAAYYAAHTNTPTTTITNDEDCHMQVGYRRIRG